MNRNDPLIVNGTNIPARLPEGHAPVLVVVVDTEEEFDWTQPFSRDSTGTTAIAAQHLAHDEVFDALGIVPTYVVDWPVATTQASVAALSALLRSGRCEIGTHLQPWVSPPHTEIVNNFNSYSCNLPAELEFEKLRLLTQAITENFGRAPTTFKAGRYGVGAHTLEAITALGYRIDASFVPHTSFAADGGPDFSRYSEQPFWFGRPQAPLLELPVTNGYCGALRSLGPALYPLLQSAPLKALRAGGIAARTRLLERIRLSPEGASAAEMKRLAATLAGAGCRVFSLTYHSPSLAPGHTPYVRTKEDLRGFVAAIKALCTFFRDELGGVFMSVETLHGKLQAQRLLEARQGSALAASA